MSLLRAPTALRAARTIRPSIPNSTRPASTAAAAAAANTSTRLRNALYGTALLGALGFA